MNEGREFAVLGDPISHSRSPAMHTAAFDALGLAHRYTRERVAAKDIGRVLAAKFEAGFGGLNLTVPLKVAALPWLEGLDPVAAKIGAVNTLVRGDSGWVGHNTDASGFRRALAQLGGGPPERIAILGAGGAARAIVAALAGAFAGAQLTLVSRRSAGGDLGGGPGLRRMGYPEFVAQAETAARADLWVDTTTVGMAQGPADFPVPLNLDALAPCARVVDIVYPSPAGGLLERAAAAGHRVQDGREMLLWQGVAALELWLGVEELAESAVRAMREAIA